MAKVFVYAEVGGVRRHAGIDVPDDWLEIEEAARSNAMTSCAQVWFDDRVWFWRDPRVAWHFDQCERCKRELCVCDKAADTINGN